jgi:hypothetical protein
MKDATKNLKGFGHGGIRAAEKQTFRRFVMTNILKWVKKCIKTIVPKKILELLYFNKHTRLFLLKKSAKKRLTKRSLLRFDIHLADHCNLKC